MEEMSTNLPNCLPPNSIVLDAAFYRTVNAKGCSVIMFTFICPGIFFLFFIFFLLFFLVKFLLGSVYLYKTIVFNANPDPAVHLSADLDPDPRIQTTSDPDHGRTLTSQKVKKILHESLLKVGYRSKNIHSQVQKPF